MSFKLVKNNTFFPNSLALYLIILSETRPNLFDITKTKHVLHSFTLNLVLLVTIFSIPLNVY
jgi:hypothetical protein